MKILEMGLIIFQVLAFIVAIWEFFKEVIKK